MECRLDTNKGHCSCTYEPCARKGRCCECLKYHWKRKELPGCLFPPPVEATYDRSLDKFIQIYGKGNSRYKEGESI